MQTDKVYTQVQVQSMALCREQGSPLSYQLELVFDSAQGEVSVTFVGLRDADNIAEILQADRLWLDVDDNQQEYGRYRLGVSHEYTSTLVFDAILH